MISVAGGELYHLDMFFRIYFKPSIHIQYVDSMLDKRLRR